MSLNNKESMEQLAKEALELWESPSLENVQRIAEISEKLGFNATEKNIKEYLNNK